MNGYCIFPKTLVDWLFGWIFWHISHYRLFNAKASLNIKTVLFQVVQFSISTPFSSIWSIDKTLSGATTPGQSEHGNDGNEGLLRILESSIITGTSASDCLVSYTGHWLRGRLTPLQRYSRCTLQPQPTGSPKLQSWSLTIQWTLVVVWSLSLWQRCNWLSLHGFRTEASLSLTRSSPANFQTVYLC